MPAVIKSGHYIAPLPRSIRPGMLRNELGKVEVKIAGGNVTDEKKELRIGREVEGLIGLVEQLKDGNWELN